MSNSEAAEIRGDLTSSTCHCRHAGAVVLVGVCLMTSLLISPYGSTLKSYHCGYKALMLGDIQCCGEFCETVLFKALLAYLLQCLCVLIRSCCRAWLTDITLKTMTLRLLFCIWARQCGLSILSPHYAFLEMCFRSFLNPSWPSSNSIRIVLSRL